MTPLRRKYYRVPREHGAAFFRPSCAELPALVERNRRLMESYGFAVCGMPYGEFRSLARAEAVRLAGRYAERWGFAVGRWSEPQPLIVTGHQPPPFHPGVWVKNFLAGWVADATGGAGINLTVDNDEVHGQVLRFPARGGAPDEVRLAEVPLARAEPGLPFEEQPASALDAGDLATCTRQACSASSLVPAGGPARALERSMLLVTQALPQAGSLAEALLVARRRLEEELGLRNLELPVSHLADGEAFRLFVAEMILRREQAHAAYNGALAEYRRVYRERSAAQPVPDLGRADRRIELPLWIWRSGAGAASVERLRRRLWVEDRQGELVLASDDRPVGAVGAASGPSPEDAARWQTAVQDVAVQLTRLRAGGWKIRPRALAMTLYVRLFVGDVFIHGLGGALYDQVTDAMVERLWGVVPPEFAVASCTVHMPLRAYPATAADLVSALRTVRDWRWNPDRMLPASVLADGRAAALIREKRLLLAHRSATPEGRRAAYLRIHAINEALAALHAEGPAEAAGRLARLQQELRWNAILKNREVPFWFYPPEDLAAFYRRLCRNTAGTEGDSNGSARPENGS